MKQTNQFLKPIKKFWNYLKKDTWDSWVVSLFLTFIVIKFIFFPALSFATGSPLPLVVVESCSMYHGVDYDEWWDRNGLWYEEKNIGKAQFEKYRFKNGLNKGDIIFVWGRSEPKIGDTIIFDGGNFKYPLIHRIVYDKPVFGTKGDNNFGQLSQEKDIPKERIMGEAVARIPIVGWLKLIFFEYSKPEEQRGFCK